MDPEAFIRAQDAKNTLKSNKFASSTVQKFFEKIGERRELLMIPPNELDGLLSRFFMEVKKKDGSQYEPDALSTIHRGYKRHLDAIKYPGNILSDKTFETSRRVLAAKRKELRRDGLGCKPRAARELTESEEDMLFEKEYFSLKTNDALQRGVWWVLAINFGFRRNDESQKLCWGDIVLESDPETNRQKLTWYKERGTKTRNGRANEAPRKILGTAFATGTGRCPVMFYQEFSRRRPSTMLSDSSPFYLSNNWSTKSDEWYLPRPMGVNTIARFLSDAKKRFNLPGNVSNHSVRKTGIGRLLDAKVPEIFVAQHSGMKNTDSLSSYKHANLKTQAEMSDIVNRNTQNFPNSSALIPSTSSSTNVNEYENLVLDDWVPALPTTTATSNNSIASRPNSLSLPLEGLFQHCQINNLHIHIHK